MSATKVKHSSAILLLLVLLGAFPTSAFAQGLVEYALILTIVGPNSAPSNYEVCAFNPTDTPIVKRFGFQPSRADYAGTRPIELELAPGETACEVYTSAGPGVLVEVIPVPPGFAPAAGGGHVVRGSGVDGLIQVGTSPPPGLRTVPVQVNLLDGEGRLLQVIHFHT